MASSSDEEIPQYTCPPLAIRRGGNSHKKDCMKNCKVCEWPLKSDDLHWVCHICREKCSDARCPNKCLACIAMEKNDGKNSMFVKGQKNRKYVKKVIKHTGRPERSSKISGDIGNQSETRKAMIKRVMKDSAVAYEEKVSKIYKLLGDHDAAKAAQGSLNNLDVDMEDEASNITDNTSASVKTQEEILQASDHYFCEYMKDLEPFLFGELDPTIPEFLMAKDVKLPEIPQAMKEQYLILRDELVRLLASASVCFQLSENLSNTDGADRSEDIMTDQFSMMFKSLITSKADEFGSAIFEIRRFLLAKLQCKDPRIIPFMTRGPIQPGLSFFGNFAKLVNVVSKSPDNVLKKKVQKKMYL